MAYESDISVEERLERAKKPGRDAMILHKFYKGKIETVPKACVRSFDDFSVWYPPVWPSLARTSRPHRGSTRRRSRRRT